MNTMAAVRSILLGTPGLVLTKTIVGFLRVGFLTDIILLYDPGLNKYLRQIITAY